MSTTDLWIDNGTAWVRRDGATRARVSGPDPDPDPDPPSPTLDASWESMVSGRTLHATVAGPSETAAILERIAGARAWYNANVGLAGLGLTAGDMTPGSLASSYDGQVIEGIEGGGIRLRHNNVTVRGCRVAVTGSGYGVQFDAPNAFSSNLRGCIVENNDIVYTPTALANETRHAMILYNATSVGNTARSVTVRGNNISGFTSAGGRLGNNVTFEYNWVHDFQYPTGPHANSCRPAGWNIIARRNLLEEGRSGISSIYFSDKSVGNVLYAENILYGRPGTSPSYWVNGGSGTFEAAATDIIWRDNYYGGFYQFGQFASGIDFGTNGHRNYGDRYYDTDALTPWNDEEPPA